MEKFILVIESIFGLIVAGFFILLFLAAALGALIDFRIFVLASIYRANKEKFMELMDKSNWKGHLLKYASEKLKSDYEVVTFLFRNDVAAAQIMKLEFLH